MRNCKMCKIDLMKTERLSKTGQREKQFASKRVSKLTIKRAIGSRIKGCAAFSIVSRRISPSLSTSFCCQESLCYTEHCSTLGGRRHPKINCIGQVANKRCFHDELSKLNQKRLEQATRKFFAEACFTLPSAKRSESDPRAWFHTGSSLSIVTTSSSEGCRTWPPLSAGCVRGHHTKRKAGLSWSAGRRIVIK